MVADFAHFVRAARDSAESQLVGKIDQMHATMTDPYQAVLSQFLPSSALLSTQTLSGGVSCQTDRLEIVDAAGERQQLILRRYHQHSAETAQREYDLLQQLHSHGLNVPQPFYLDCSSRRLPDPFIIMQQIDGELVLAPRNRTSYLTQFAQQLVQIHQLSIPVAALPFVPKIGRRCQEGQAPTSQSPWVDLTPLRTWLAARQAQYANPTRLLHGDFWAGNLLWRDGKLIAVVDWEDAKIGEPLIDFARSRVETAVLFGDAACRQFSRAYQAQMPLDYRDLAYWDGCAALRLARLIGDNLQQFCRFFPQYGRRDITPAYVQDNFRLFISDSLQALQDTA